MQLTINGDIKKWASGTLNINDNINDRSRCDFILDADNSIEVGHEVIIIDNGTRIFAGTIEIFNKRYIKGIIRYNIQCVDFNRIADKRRVAKTYEDKTVSYIVNDIITSYLAEEGVTAGTIETGPTLKQVVFNYKKATECFDYIKEATGLNWNINYNKQLDIFYRENNTDTGFSAAENNFMDINVEETREDYRNRQIIRAGKDTTDVIEKEEPTPKPDGVSRKFSLRFPVANKPTFYINDVEVSGSNVGINGLDSNKKWYWNKDSKDIVQDSSETVLSDTDTITITYQGLKPIIVQSDNPAAQDEREVVEGGTGIYENLENVASIDKKEAALDYANGLLQRYSEIPQVLNIRTRTFKQAGRLIPVSVPVLEIDDEYLIESVNITEQGGVFYYDIKALSGESLGSWVEFFRKLRANQNDFLIRENEVLILLTKTAETQTWSEGTSSTIFACPVPSDDLYPQSSAMWSQYTGDTWSTLTGSSWHELEGPETFFPC